MHHRRLSRPVFKIIGILHDAKRVNPQVACLQPLTDFDGILKCPWQVLYKLAESVPWLCSSSMPCASPSDGSE